MRILSSATAVRSTFDCERWARLPTNATREDVSHGHYVHDLYEASFSGNFERAADSLFQYKIFPIHRMRAFVDTPNRRVTIGVTIVQRIIFGPVAIESGVRVIEVERTRERAMFAYATLQGHPERGIASFAVIRDGATGKFQAQAWSRSGSWLAIVG